MTDIADVAALIADEHIARGIAAARAVFQAGVAGTCDDCGEDMPRLVDGRCGYCRDGRRPPLTLLEARAARLAHTSTKEEPMPTAKPTDTSQTISVPAHGRALLAIRERASEQDLPLGRAALAIIEEGLNAVERVDLLATIPHAAQQIAEIATDQLLTELGRRLGEVARNQALVERAEAAEARLAAVQAALGPAS